MIQNYPIRSKENKLRYQAVCRPLSYANPSLITSPKMKCLTAWIASLIFSLPVLNAEMEKTSCHLKMGQVPWLDGYLPFICFILPLTIITVVYCSIFCTMMKKIKAKTRSGRVRLYSHFLIFLNFLELQALSLVLKTVTTPLSLPSTPTNETHIRRLSKSHDTGLQMTGRSPLSRQKSQTIGKSLETSLHLNGVEPEVKKLCSLQSLRNNLLGLNYLSNPSWKSFSEEIDIDADPLAQLRWRAHKKIKAGIARERRLAMVMCILVGVFILCYLPFWSIYVCLGFNQSCTPPPHLAMALVQWLAMSTSLLNPILYTVFNEEFREAIKKTLHSCLPF